MKINSTQSINFMAMKPNQFKGFDYACVRKFKAPVEKFEDKTNFNNWAFDKLQSILKEKNLFTQNGHIAERRKELLYEWRKALGFDSENAPLSLIVISSFLKKMKLNNDKLFPPFSKKILAETKAELETCLEKNKDYQFNFNDLYCKNFKQHYLSNAESDFTGWVKIPSKTTDKENFAENTIKLKVLSGKMWCTKSYNADLYLANNDFHIWLENGKPKIALRIEDGKLVEIQGELNNGNLPAEYFEVLNKYVCEKNFPLLDKAFNTYHNAGKAYAQLNN